MIIYFILLVLVLWCFHSAYHLMIFLVIFLLLLLGLVGFVGFCQFGGLGVFGVCVCGGFCEGGFAVLL